MPLGGGSIHRIIARLERAEVRRRATGHARAATAPAGFRHPRPAGAFVSSSGSRWPGGGSAGTPEPGRSRSFCNPNHVPEK